MHHPILVMAILCKGQGTPSPPPAAPLHVKGVLQLLSKRYGHIHFAQVPERVLTNSSVLIIGTSRVESLRRTGHLDGEFCCSRWSSLQSDYRALLTYARRMGQPTQRATNYTARSNIEPTSTAQARPDQAALATSTASESLYTHSHELPALIALAQHITRSHHGIDEQRPTEKCVCTETGE